MERDVAIKKWGVVYSPYDIAKKLTEKCFQNISCNRLITVLDISCGNGVFLTAACEVLSEEYFKNQSKYTSFLPVLESREDAWRFVANNCVFGMDILSGAIIEASTNIASGLDDIDLKDHLIVVDALTINKAQLPVSWPASFDVLLGNPPYVGHKHLSKERRIELSEYSDVFSDKADLSFCFLKKICQWMNPKSVAGVLTSRALVDAFCGRGIRNYLNQQIEILELYDFTDINIFPNINVLSVALLFSRKQNSDYSFRVERFSMESTKTSKFKICSDQLTDRRWSLLKSSETKFIERIQRNCLYQLGDIVEFNQGIITGLDKAFIVSKEEIEKYDLEEKLLHPWLKSTMILKNSINQTPYRIIYTDDIQVEETYPNSVEYIQKFQKKLMSRRECMKGYRPWYGLQWGRKKDVFLQPKIIFPYKSENNRFAIDEKGHMFSADIYGMRIKKEMSGLFSLPFLQKVLNSELYTEYFRLFAKKGVNRQYDYYPNSLKELYIPNPENFGDLFPFEEDNFI